MRNIVTVAVLLSSLAALTSLFAQSSAPAQTPAAKPPGSESNDAAAGQTAPSKPAWLVPAAIAAGVVAVVVIARNSDSNSTQNH